jgi:hypothetical protein
MQAQKLYCESHRKKTLLRNSRKQKRMVSIIAITDDLPAHTDWLAATEGLHRQLRPGVPKPYGDYMRRMFDEGAERKAALCALRPYTGATTRRSMATDSTSTISLRTRRNGGVVTDRR